MRARQIYFMRQADGTGPIKIGCSAWPKCRLTQLQSHLHIQLSLLASAPGSFTIERNLHYKFRDARSKHPGTAISRFSVGGPTEWFEATPQLLGIVAAVAATGQIHLDVSDRLEIVFAERFLAGETLRAIASDYGFSHERIRQVLREHGCPTNRWKCRQFLAERRAAA